MLSIVRVGQEIPDDNCLTDFTFVILQLPP